MLDKIKTQLDELESLGVEVEHGEPQSEKTVLELEKLLGATLPASYREFLKNLGFAGPSDSVYYGISSPSTLRDVGVYAVTIELRETYRLPASLLVIRHDYDMKLCHCIDLSQHLDNDECPVVFAQYKGNQGCEISSTGETFLEAITSDFESMIRVERKAEADWKF